jgi:hypothetical protein
MREVRIISKPLNNEDYSDYCTQYFDMLCQGWIQSNVVHPSGYHVAADRLIKL